MAYSAGAQTLSPPTDAAWLAAALGHLPVAVGLVDRTGRFISRSGGLRDLLGDAIPSRTSGHEQRWVVHDDAGAPLDPRQWPSERALRGEAVTPGATAFYHSGKAPPREMRVIAAPLQRVAARAVSVVLIQDYDPVVRANNRQHDHLEARFGETLIGSISDMVRNDRTRTPEQGYAAVSRTMGFPIITRPRTPEDLTHREDQVLKLLAWGASQKEVGAAIGVSAKTVDFHRIRAARKLNLRTRADLVRYAVRRGWFVEDAM